MSHLGVIPTAYILSMQNIYHFKVTRWKWSDGHKQSCLYEST